MKIRVIDIETTGLDPDKDKIVEIGSVDYLGGEIIYENAMECLVDPLIPIPPEASAVHHLIDDDVVRAETLEQVLPKFEGADLYVAHNSSFEAGFLPKTWQWLCTYKAAVRIWPDAPSFSNQVLRYWLGLHEIPGFTRSQYMSHRALPDAAVTALILHKLLDHTTPEEMQQWTNEPVVLPRFGFGKHAGEPVADIPAGYLEWITTKDDMNEDVRHTANTELKRRAGQ